ncbi:sugar ABC transporter ATP-binding protein [Echinicola soli]|uniref:Sugar ABC transporter ATP-binding protein n=1 Tax=Echinicola soli TaxID=2591634 RepID=A0A514CEI6_9BACT|nr:sugar ABC transporter ATP-binding protein [Echinicola soli]QDH78242.1 sugar ABC transporter ATP-binding protein [Echinicola soli]
MLTVKNITKEFAGVKALDNVSLELQAGQVTAILGENGAGKSTLMKILSGVYPDYDGTIYFHGKPVKFQNTKEAQEIGINIIHQELNLIPYLGIRENIFLGRELETAIGLLDVAKMHKESVKLLKKLKLDMDPETPVSQLKVGQQQLVEIAKALSLESQVIIMDEPTSAISDQEVEILFEIVRHLKEEGKAIAYISHKLDELFAIADRYVVLRDGQMIEAGKMEGMTEDALIQKMVGREVVIERSCTDRQFDEKILSVKNLTVKHPKIVDKFLLKDINFELGKGEVLGIFGLMGAGRTELMEALFGVLPHQGAEITLAGKVHEFKKPLEAMDAGLALVPEDRKHDGLVLCMDVCTNSSLTVVDSVLSGGLLDEKKEKGLAQKYMGELKIKASSHRQVVEKLSGGNQQKVVLAKWLATRPKVLMLDEPTRGIDINAKNEIYKLIRQLASEGLGLIVVSSELPEILAISDRVLVMAEGRLTANIPISKQTSEDEILQAAIPKNKERIK